MLALMISNASRKATRGSAPAICSQPASMALTWESIRSQIRPSAPISRQRHEGQRRIARSLAKRGALRRDLRPRQAEDVIHALMSPEIYRLLVVERGWSPDQYAEWLSATLIDQLLAPE